MNQPLQLEHLAAFSSRLSTESLIDDLTPTHSAKQDQIHASIISTLLALMDRLDGRSQIVVIGATNSPEASSRHSHDADADEDDDVMTKLSRTSGTLLATERRIRRVRNPLPPPPPPQQGPKIQGPPSAPNASPDVMLHEPPRKKGHGSIDDAPQSSSDLEPEEEGDGKPYALRQQQRINYTIPPELEEMRKPPPKANGGE
ncbi:hypothetical protein D9615_010349 [Tricholomella constricta]|uniref:ATPase AAA-type core domain-containing protein n=1 Tax=Tricholomella constricta TaxID=117010 RepID=A0A8H5GT10_9AGAR|nr:hypothetical protein D9615_010349 [Tricholomella constricta]